MKDAKRWIVVCLAAFIAGSVISVAVDRHAVNRQGRMTESPTALPRTVRANIATYKYINPLLFTTSTKSVLPVFQNLSATLAAQVRTATSSGIAQSVSVYVRDMNDNEWTGVGEDEKYTPSSMLKVVAMMSALKLAESDPAILQTKLSYHKTAPANELFPAHNWLQSGSYTIQDLVSAMIVYSDNDAFDALVTDPRINAEFVRAYDLFRLPASGLTGSTTDFMSPRSYSTIYRVLYNSSFFEWNLSEQVLDLLTRTTFSQGIVAGVPAGTLVAHKFGENTNELHDCGIIYYPGHPYFLCVMTRGTDAAKLQSVIAGVSKTVWKWADKAYAL